jgi:hypothetical protein
VVDVKVLELTAAKVQTNDFQIINYIKVQIEKLNYLLTLAKAKFIKVSQKTNKIVLIYLRSASSAFKTKMLI